MPIRQIRQLVVGCPSFASIQLLPEAQQQLLPVKGVTNLARQRLEEPEIIGVIDPGRRDRRGDDEGAEHFVAADHGSGHRVVDRVSEVADALVGLHVQQDRPTPADGLPVCVDGRVIEVELDHRLGTEPDPPGV